MNVLQPLMNEKEIQTDDENIHNQLVNLINSMLFNQRWLNKNRKVNTLRNLLKNCCYISMFNRLLLTMIERPRTLLLQSFTLLSSSSSALSSSSSSSSSISNDLFIIGAGQMRTGTTSLKFALQLLYNQSCYHMYDIIYHYQESHIQKWINLFNMNKKFINIEKIHWNDIFNECRFAVDYPTCVFYKELMKIYPNAKVILTVRDADSWVSSCRATTASDMVMTKHTTFTENIIYRLRGLKSLPILHDNMYTKAFGPNYDQMTDDELRDAFIKWNQEIIDYVPKDRLLIFDPKDGWTPLCEFLNIPIPENVPFPHLNKRVDLRNRLLKYRFLAQFLNFSLMISFLCTEEIKYFPYKRIIPHGYCIKDDLNWRPHNLALNPIYTDYGLDWSSKLRYIEAYKDEDRRDENIWPEHSSHLRTFPKLKCHGMSPEWSIYTNGYATGKKCLFDGIHQRSVYCTSEYILRDGFTHKRRRDTIEQHNSIFKSMKPGDKSYGSVEYSPNFYKINSSVPKVRFGIQSTEHEYNQDLKLLLKELRELDGWKPAPTLTETISSVKFSRK
ncbi:unnamed protein product [Schistosoma rodhaini]|nr:unnamed protein product [Schistosoma rodhaini]